jgi:hypothetical protein
MMRMVSSPGNRSGRLARDPARSFSSFPGAEGSVGSTSGPDGGHQRYAVEDRKGARPRAITDALPELRQLAEAAAHHRFDRGQNSLRIHHPARCPADVLQEEPVEIAASPGERPSREPQLGQQSARHDQQRQVESESQPNEE